MRYSIYEVFKRTLQQRGEELALQVVALMSQGHVVELDRTLAIAAASISHELKLPMADSIILATARAYRAVLWTQDIDLKGFESVEYISKK